MWMAAGERQNYAFILFYFIFLFFYFILFFFIYFLFIFIFFFFLLKRALVWYLFRMRIHAHIDMS